MRPDVVDHAQGVDGLIERGNGHVGGFVGVVVEHLFFMGQERATSSGAGKNVQGFPNALGIAPELVHIVEKLLAVRIGLGVKRGDGQCLFRRGLNGRGNCQGFLVGWRRRRQGVDPALHILNGLFHLRDGERVHGGNAEMRVHLRAGGSVV